MSGRSPIQVPDELKSKIDFYKEEFNAKTHYEVIENLVQRHESFKGYIQQQNDYKEQQKANWVAEKLRQEHEMLQLDSNLKEQFNALKDELSINNDSSLLEFLLAHYHASSNFDKSTLLLLRDLK